MFIKIVWKGGNWKYFLSISFEFARKHISNTVSSTKEKKKQAQIERTVQAGWSGSYII